MTNQITVTGYYEGGECSHCARELRHCVVTDHGVFGARCFGQQVTAPRQYRGKAYRLTADAVISLAKMARQPARFGIGPDQLTFEGA